MEGKGEFYSQFQRINTKPASEQRHSTANIGRRLSTTNIHLIDG